MSRDIFKASYKTEIESCIWLLVAMMSLKSSLKEALKKIILCEGYSDLTGPTSNTIPDIHKSVSVVYDTLKNYFSCMCVHIVESFILTVR